MAMDRSAAEAPNVRQTDVDASEEFADALVDLLERLLELKARPQES